MAMSGSLEFERRPLDARGAVGISGETVHIIGLALLFGTIVVVDLRLLGLGRNVSAVAVTRNVLPWTLAGFAVAAATGSLMFTAHAAEFATLPIFLLKMTLIVLGGIYAALLRAGALKSAGMGSHCRAARRRRRTALDLRDRLRPAARVFLTAGTRPFLPQCARATASGPRSAARVPATLARQIERKPLDSI
jgi:hypothetical protein